MSSERKKAGLPQGQPEEEAEGLLMELEEER